MDNVADSQGDSPILDNEMVFYRCNIFCTVKSIVLLSSTHKTEGLEVTSTRLPASSSCCISSRVQIWEALSAAVKKSSSSPLTLVW